MSALRKVTYALAQAYSEGYVSSDSPIRHHFDYEIGRASTEDQAWLACDLHRDARFQEAAGSRRSFILMMMAYGRSCALDFLIEDAEKGFEVEPSA